MSATTSEYIPAHLCQPNSYLASRVELDVKLPGSGVIAGQARRTGVTSPGYLDRAVYQLYVGWKDGKQVQLPGYWVLDSDRFIESTSWHAAYGNTERGIEG